MDREVLKKTIQNAWNETPHAATFEDFLDHAADKIIKLQPEPQKGELREPIVNIISVAFGGQDYGTHILAIDEVYQNSLRAADKIIKLRPEFKKLAMFPELVEALEIIMNLVPGTSWHIDAVNFGKAKDTLIKAKALMEVK